MGKQLGWNDAGEFYDAAMRSALWIQRKGALGFLQGLLAYEVFGGKYEVHESSTYRKKKWFAFSLKGSTAPIKSPKEQWIPCGGPGRRLSLTGHSTTGRVRVSIGGAPEAAPETSRAPPAPWRVATTSSSVLLRARLTDQSSRLGGPFTVSQEHVPRTLLLSRDARGRACSRSGSTLTTSL
jgi:hypothetical protein